MVRPKPNPQFRSEKWAPAAWFAFLWRQCPLHRRRWRSPLLDLSKTLRCSPSALSAAWLALSNHTRYEMLLPVSLSLPWPTQRDLLTSWPLFAEIRNVCFDFPLYCRHILSSSLNGARTSFQVVGCPYRGSCRSSRLLGNISGEEERFGYAFGRCPGLYVTMGQMG